MTKSENTNCQQEHEENRIEPIDATAEEIAEVIFAAADSGCEKDIEFTEEEDGVDYNPQNSSDSRAVQERFTRSGCGLQ